MKMIRIFTPGLVALILTALLIATASTATVFARAWTTEQLETQLKASNPASYSSVLVFMNGQLDVEQARSQQRLAKYTRQAAHKILVEDLRDFADRNQADIRQALDQGIASGAVKSYESYWIASAFQVEATADFINQLVDRADVAAVIEDVPLEALYNPSISNSSQSDLSGTASLPPNLPAIGADEMWALGYTGQGRLVCSFDSGVEGTHPALASTWRGLTHSAAESWFDPVYHEEFPHRAFDLNFSTAIHGTHTMGVLVGKDDATGDTVGVAFGAQWISAMVIDIPGTNYLEAFQWAADPDGDPNTIEDVPDVINHSWGFRQSIISCLDIFWIPIDNVEALGCVNVFACGNEGTENPQYGGAFTIRNPANRATSETNSFSVGATNNTGTLIWGGSSKGPSDCDSISIKPEVVAPGYIIRTATVNSAGGAPEYTDVVGTSFAAPHVAGAVALLRQVNPNATVDEIKLALMNSAHDLGVGGEDNTYGHGLIDIPAAMALLPAIDDVNIFVQSLEHDPLMPGEEFDFVVNLKNTGLSTLGVTGQLLNPGNGVTIVNSAANFGNIEMDSTANNESSPFRIGIAPGFLQGEYATVELQINDNSSFQKNVTLFFRIGELLSESKAHIEADSVKFTITNYGIYGLAAGSAHPDNGVGYVYKGTGVNNLYQCSFLVGVAGDTVSDALRNLLGSVDHDFTVAPGGNLVSFDNGDLGDHETFSRFNDSFSYKPIGVTVEQRTATYAGAANGNFVVLEYTLINDTPNLISGLYAGMYYDWDFPWGSGGDDRASFYRSAGSPDVGYMYRHNGADYRGMAILNDEGASTFWAIWNADVIYDNITEAEKYEFLTHGLADSASTNFGDQSCSIACGPFTLDPGESDTVAIAIIAGRSKDEIFSTAQYVRGLYRSVTPVHEDHDVVLPRGFALHQNYPNPFNPVTEISFTLPRTAHATLCIYNALGQRVATLSDRERPAGTYSIVWNGMNDRGEAVASGVYFYRLETDDFVETRKMVLMK